MSRSRLPTLILIAVAVAFGAISLMWHLLVESEFDEGETFKPLRGWQRQPEGSFHVINPGMDGESSGGLARLASLPYLAGYEPPRSSKQIAVFDIDRAWRGLNFYTSGHAAAARLINMEGRTIYEWGTDPINQWSEFTPSESSRFVYPEWGYWRRGHLFPNGDLIVIYEGAGLVKLDRHSQILWAYWGGCHHDLDVLADGRIFTLIKEALSDPPGIESPMIINDLIVELDASGKEQARLSLLEAFVNSDYASLLDRSEDPRDIFHTNTISVLDGSHAGLDSAFGEGNILVSIREQNALAVVDFAEGRIVWAVQGPWRAQHEPQFLPNGNVLLFNNQFDKERSEILEFNPLTVEAAWSYRSPGFYSSIIGSQQRLPNGNTLITESVRGRAFEVTPEGELVWEFNSPHRAGDAGELVATLFELRRFSRESLPFLEPVAAPHDHGAVGGDNHPR